MPWCTTYFSTFVCWWFSNSCVGRCPKCKPFEKYSWWVLEYSWLVGTSQIFSSAQTQMWISGRKNVQFWIFWLESLTGKYPGLPARVGADRSEYFQFLMDNVRGSMYFENFPREGKKCSSSRLRKLYRHRFHNICKKFSYQNCTTSCLSM